MFTIIRVAKFPAYLLGSDARIYSWGKLIETTSSLGAGGMHTAFRVWRRWQHIAQFADHHDTLEPYNTDTTNADHLHARDAQQILPNPHNILIRRGPRICLWRCDEPQRYCGHFPSREHIFGFPEGSVPRTDHSAEQGIWHAGFCALTIYLFFQ